MRHGASHDRYCATANCFHTVCYSYARRHALDPRFVFGTGKLGDLAGFASAIVLVMIALIIGYEAAARLFAPVTIHFDEAILIAAAGLIVNIITALLLGGGTPHGHSHGHPHGHSAAHAAHGHGETRRIETRQGTVLLDIFEDRVPPRFRLRHENNLELAPVPGEKAVTLETLRPGGVRQIFRFAARGRFLELIEEIPEPHARAGSVCLNSRLAAAKWISAMVMLQPRLAAAQ